LSDRPVVSSGQHHDGRTPSKAAGAYSLAEILSQPEAWGKSLEKLDQGGQLRDVRRDFSKAEGWLFIGCGSSYYVALAAAATMNSVSPLPARALPASEILLYPELVLASAKNFVPVLISRSGKTSEVLQATELLNSRSFPTLAITCAAGQPLEALASRTILLPADEQSTVMTRSFSSMLLALQELAAVISGNSGLSDALHRLPQSSATMPSQISNVVRQFVATHDFADYVCLGQGPFYGLACEYALKVTEMSISYSQAFHSLEFRHGPKSIVGPETLLTFLISEPGCDAESELLFEMKSLGATTLVVTNKADSRVRAASDLLIELSLDIPELARLTPSLFAGQLLGLHTGIHKGLDPDNPRNLSRVVMLDESKHATL